MTFEINEHLDHRVELRPSKKVGAILRVKEDDGTFHGDDVEYVEYCVDCDEVIE